MTIAEEIRLETRVDSILELLEWRFGHSHSDSLRESLARIDSTDRLKALLLETIRVSSIDEFLALLN